MKRSVATLAVLLTTSAATAQEAPSRIQGNAGLDAGIAGAGSGRFWQRSPLFLGARGDLLFGRASNRDWGIGPMAGLGTYAFHDWSAQVGASILVPVHEYLPFVLSAGPFVRRDGAWDPGVFGTVFWGNRSFNYHSDYVLSAGLLVETRVGFGDARERTVIVAAHLDGEVLLLPAFLLVNAFR